MKKYIFTVTLATSLNSWGSSQPEHPLKVCWESELKPPYLMQSENKQLNGIAVDWLDRILHTQGMSYVNLAMPWKRCLLSLQRGYVDIVPNSSYKQSRASFAYFSNELYRTHLDFYYLKRKIKNPQQLIEPEQFSSYIIGGVRGFNYAFYDGLFPIDTGAADREALVNKLLKGRVHFAILQREVLTSLYRSRQEVLQPIASLAAPNNSFKPFYILVGRDHPNARDIVSGINKGIKQLHRTGEYQQILDSYLK